MALELLPDFIPWVVPWIILPLIPYIKIVETLCKNDVPNLDRNTPESQVFWHMAILVTWAVVYPLLVIFILWAVCNIPTLLLYERLVLLVFCGMLGRLVTITSHDLIHRPKLWMRRLAEFTMGTIAMPNMYTEHVYMHHPNVATPRDRSPRELGKAIITTSLQGFPMSMRNRFVSKRAGWPAAACRSGTGRTRSGYGPPCGPPDPSWR